MRRALSISLLAVTAIATATPAAAQQPPTRTHNDGHSLGLRYLSWPGRAAPARTALERPAATPSRRTPAVIPHGTPPEPAPSGPGFVPARGLTPANTWMSPAAPTPEPTAPVPLPTVSAAPTAPAPTAETSTVPTVPPVTDPMVPRRDALIYRMQGAPASPPQPRTPVPDAPPARTPAAASTGGPVEQGARYYSVHRQNNRQPDPTPLPSPTYVDAIAVDLPASLASQDLAAPPEPPTLIRNAQGRLQAMPDTSTPDQL